MALELSKGGSSETESELEGGHLSSISDGSGLKSGLVFLGLQRGRQNGESDGVQAQRDHLVGELPLVAPPAHGPGLGPREHVGVGAG